MSGHSREGQPPHARGPVEICPLTPGDSAELSRYLRDKDVWPEPQRADLASLLGRNDAASFCARVDGGLVGVASCILDGSTLRVLHLIVESCHEEAAGLLLARVDVQARIFGASAVFAQAAEDSKMFRLFVSHGYQEDFREGDVLAGRPVTVVDLVKLVQM